MRARSFVLIPLIAPFLLLGLADIPAPPAIDQGGVFNAASQMPPSLPGGAIARGARFTLTGVRLGPGKPVTAGDSNPPASLAGVSVRITQGEAHVDAGLFLVSEDRIEGWIPASAPLGAVQLFVTYQERISEPYALEIVDSSFGFFTSGTAPGPLPEAGRPSPASPGQAITLWGTGRGKAALEIFVGGKPATVTLVAAADCCRGVDRIEFQVPRDAPLGCYVPVQARGADGRISNTVGLAIQEAGGPCRDRIDWFRQSVEHASRAGFVVLASISLAALDEEYRFDYGLASFGSQESGQRPLPPFPPPGTCAQFTERINVRQVLGQARSPSTWTSIPKPLPGNRRLDAGPALSVAGPGGIKRLERDPRRNEYYNALLGGRVPLLRVPPAPLFLRPGSYSVSTRGGLDIGGFSAQVRVLHPLRWKNREQVTEIRRSSGTTLEWAPSRREDAVVIAAGSADRFSGDSALAVCIASAADGRFTVPPLALANLPVSSGQRDLDAGYLLVAEIPVRPPAHINASGLDAAFVASVSVSARPVMYK